MPPSKKITISPEIGLMIAKALSFSKLTKTVSEHTWKLIKNKLVAKKCLMIYPVKEVSYSEKVGEASAAIK